ncbi:MAG: circadian phase modifier CpmA [Pseudonocardia sp. SCN 72-86]|nr:MAG: circadian phase modifier CpmA [Pseudonocardia sp. SCN 72-86]
MTDREIRLDFARSDRVGFDEAILCAGKADDQLVEIMDQFVAKDSGVLMTRLQPDVAARIPDEHQRRLDYCAVSRTAWFNRVPAPGRPPGVAVVAAGSSDMPQVAEVTRTLGWFEVATSTFVDVGVAGLWRLLEHVETLRQFPVLVVVAGMDGALPSVLGGLVPGVVICLPTSTGYGVSRGGETALHAALASCASGLTVVNIDNGYGAACAAFRAVASIRRDSGLPGRGVNGHVKQQTST